MSKLVFFGNEQLSSTRSPSRCAAFSELLDNNYEIELLIIKEKPGKSRTQRPPAIVELAEAHNVPIARVTNKIELKDALENVQAEIAVLAAFGMIIDQSVIDIFPHGIVNIHPSLLPKYRGTTPIETALLNGDTQTGVSLMHLDASMDGGPLYTQQSISVAENITKAELTDELDSLGAQMLIDCLPLILDNQIEPERQDDSKATFTKRLSKEDSLLDFSKPALQLEREIRAYADWPGSRTTIADVPVTVTRAHAVPTNDTAKNPGDYWVIKEAGVLAIETTNGYLCVERLRPEGKNEMMAADFINGYIK